MKISTTLLLCLIFGMAGSWMRGQTPPIWKIHDMNRPRPPVMEPPAPALPAPPPTDATVLLSGGDLSQWHDGSGGPAPWKSEDGYVEAVPGNGSIVSRAAFGDVQLHLEWSAPTPAVGEGQNRGNSGVYLMGRYEVQILDSYRNVTYADGQAAAIYGQHPPLVNACLPPGEWQSYDVFFRRPRFGPNGHLQAPARMTVVHNGILVQDAVELVGITSWLQPLPYTPHPDRQPILLQEHDSPVRFRNIWARQLDETRPPGPEDHAGPPVVLLPENVLERYVGRYQFEDDAILTISREGSTLRAHFFGPMSLELVAHSTTAFSFRWTAADLVFELDDEGKPVAVTFSIGGEQRKGVRPGGEEETETDRN